MARRHSSKPIFDEGPSDEDLDRFGGVTTTCTHCGTELYDDVAVCWKCGMALGSARKGGLPPWALAVLLLLVVALGLTIF